MIAYYCDRCGKEILKNSKKEYNDCGNSQKG